jgi:hypothetical protein
MSKPIRVATGTEAQMDALSAVVDKALGFPMRGTNVGGGQHVVSPETWDGTGETPLGWTKSATAPWTASATDAVLPIPDDLVTELQRPAAQVRLTGGERATLATAIAARTAVVLDGRTPKARAAEKAAEGKNK